MPEITSRPYHPEAACEACVFGRGIHAEWCASNLDNERITDALIENGAGKPVQYIHPDQVRSEHIVGQPEFWIRPFSFARESQEAEKVMTAPGAFDELLDDHIAKKNAIWAEAKRRTAQQLS